jgi:hypothetical protein
MGGGEYASGERGAFPHLGFPSLVSAQRKQPLKGPDHWTAFPSSPVASRAQEKELGGHGTAAGRKAGSTPPESATRSHT